MATFIIITPGAPVEQEIVACPECDLPAELRKVDLERGVVLLECPPCGLTFTKALPEETDAHPRL